MVNFLKNYCFFFTFTLNSIILNKNSDLFHILILWYFINYKLSVYIIFIAAPYSPYNCTIGNVTTVSLEVRCKEGFDGGLPQTFLLEVINFTTGSVMLNLSSHEPYFQLNKLAPGNSVQVKVYALNVKGKSAAFVLEGSTLKAEKQTGNFYYSLVYRKRYRNFFFFLY